MSLKFAKVRRYKLTEALPLSECPNMRQTLILH